MGTLSNLVTVIGTLIVMFVAPRQLFFAALALPAFAFPVPLGKRSYKAVEHAVARAWRESVVLEETMELYGSRVIKNFGTEVREYLRFRTLGMFAPPNWSRRSSRSGFL